MFQVINTRTGRISFTTDSLRAAYIMQDRENYKETGVGYEPCWEIRAIEGGHTYRVTVEEL